MGWRNGSANARTSCARHGLEKRWWSIVTARYVYRSKVIQDIILANNDSLEVLPGGIAYGTTVGIDCTLQVDAGAVAIGTILSSAGIDIVYGTDVSPTIAGHEYV